MQLASLKIRATRKNPFSSLPYVDLRPLSLCKQLTEVDLGFLSGCDLVDLGPLAACVYIRSLYLSDKAMVSNLSPLSTLVELTSLYLRSYDRNGAGLLPLAQCSILEELTLCCRRLSDVGALQELPRLRVLVLKDCPSLVDISPLSHCILLNSLTITCCGVSEESISALKAAKPGLSVAMNL